MLSILGQAPRKSLWSDGRREGVCFNVGAVFVIIITDATYSGISHVQPTSRTR